MFLCKLTHRTVPCARVCKVISDHVFYRGGMDFRTISLAVYLFSFYKYILPRILGVFQFAVLSSFLLPAPRILRGTIPRKRNSPNELPLVIQNLGNLRNTTYFDNVLGVQCNGISSTPVQNNFRVIRNGFFIDAVFHRE